MEIAQQAISGNISLAILGVSIVRLKRMAVVRCRTTGWNIKGTRGGQEGGIRKINRSPGFESQSCKTTCSLGYVEIRQVFDYLPVYNLYGVKTEMKRILETEAGNVFVLVIHSRNNTTIKIPKDFLLLEEINSNN